MRTREDSGARRRVPASGGFVSAQNALIGALLPHRAAIVADCEMKLIELQYLDVPVR